MRIYKLTNWILFTVCVFVALVSCNEKETNDYKVIENALTLNKESVTMSPGDKLELTPQFDIKGNTGRTYYWITDNPRMIDITKHDDLSATIVAKRLGKAKVTIKSTDGALEASCDINVVKSATGGIMRILTIGNEYSEDAVESYLYNLAKQQNLKLEIGDLYLEGATLEDHNTNTDSTQKVYQLRIIDQFGDKSNTSEISLKEAILSEDWDYISFQQEAAVSGLFNTYVSTLPHLFGYVKGLTTNPEVQFLFHQTWAYGQSSDADGFLNYDNNQMVMYDSIVQVLQLLKTLVPIDKVVPVGTAIQNARTSIIGNDFCRDGARLNEKGKYVAACTWFESIFDKNVIGNGYFPKELSSYEAEIAQHAAHLAIDTPEKVTVMVDYQSAGFLDKSIFVGFGSESVLDGWNAFLSNNNYNTGARIDNLVDEDGGKTGISIEITKSFNDVNNSGVADVSTDFAIPSVVSQHSYYGNGRGVWLDKKVRESAFKISNLNKDQSLNFCFFSSRDGVSDNRETKFIVKGATTATVYLNASNNSSNTVCANGIRPDANGEINVTVTMGENNNNGSGFFYINAMRIAPAN